MHDLKHFRAAIAIAACLLLVSCGGNSETHEDGGASVSALVDPRFATPEAFIVYYNELTTVEPIRWDDKMALYRDEGGQQAEMIRAFRAFGDLAQLDWMMRQHFNEGWQRSSPHAMLAARKPAEIKSIEGDRAIATQLAPTGMETLRLVKADRRWWISGATYEQELEGTTISPDWSQSAESAELMAEAARNIMSRIEAGEFSHPQQVRVAIDREMRALRPAADEEEE